jgi:anthraniloyl-CoA monooxygenase
VRKNKFVWFGTHQVFEAFTFAFEQLPEGWVWAHAYRFDDALSTFIVEMEPETWERLGFDRMDQPQAIARCEAIFAKYLGGHSLMSNARHLSGPAMWLNFRRIICERWHYRNLILLGDAAHTAHFSIGSGTKLALEDAIKLAEVLNRPGLSREAALAEYREERQIEVLKLQNSARNSTEWFETLDRYLHFEPIQFAYSLLTRSQRVSHENLRLRDRSWLEGVERWFQSKARGHQVNDPPRPCSRRSGCARWSCQPRRGVADGDLFGGGRLPDRLPPRPLRHARAGRRGAGLYRDDLRLGRGRITPGLRGPLRARACRAWRGWWISSTQHPGQILPAARP